MGEQPGALPVVVHLGPYEGLQAGLEVVRPPFVELGQLKQHQSVGLVKIVFGQLEGTFGLLSLHHIIPRLLHLRKLLPLLLTPLALS